MQKQSKIRIPQAAAGPDPEPMPVTVAVAAQVQPDAVRRGPARSLLGGGGVDAAVGHAGMSNGAATVLHIDDDPNDTELLHAAARKAEVDFQLHNAVDGERAIAYLSGSGVFGCREAYPLPSLILLDLKMPRATGFEILRWIRDRAELRDIPVIVLSGSQHREDMDLACQFGANSYVVKPLGFEALVSFVKDISSAWLAGRVTD